MFNQDEENLLVGISSSHKSAFIRGYKIHFSEQSKFESGSRVCYKKMAGAKSPIRRIEATGLEKTKVMPLKTSQ